MTLGPRPRLIEFVGLPGAGKSTIVACLEDELRTLGLATPRHIGSREGPPSVGARVRNWLDLAGLAFRNPRLFLRSVQLVASLRPVTKVRIRNCTALLRFDRLPSGGAFVLRDQGKIQRVWSTLMFADGEVDEARLTLLWKAYSQGLLDTVVFVDCSVQTAMSRLQARPGTESRVERIPEEAARPLLEDGAKQLRRLSMHCAHTDGARFLAVDGEADVEENVAKLLDVWLNRQRSGSDPS